MVHRWKNGFSFCSFKSGKKYLYHFVLLWQTVTKWLVVAFFSHNQISRKLLLLFICWEEINCPQTLIEWMDLWLKRSLENDSLENQYILQKAWLPILILKIHFWKSLANRHFPICEMLLHILTTIFSSNFYASGKRKTLFCIPQKVVIFLVCLQKWSRSAVGQTSVIKNEQHIYLDEKKVNSWVDPESFFCSFCSTQSVRLKVCKVDFFFLEEPFFFSWTDISFVDTNLLNSKMKVCLHQKNQKLLKKVLQDPGNRPKSVFL